MNAGLLHFPSKPWRVWGGSWGAALPACGHSVRSVCAGTCRGHGHRCLSVQWGSSRSRDALVVESGEGASVVLKQRCVSSVMLVFTPPVIM